MNNQIVDGLGTQLRRLIQMLDGDLEYVYRRDGLAYRPRYTPVMKALSRSSDQTIKEIASLSSISHSAASQTVSKMMAEGLVEQKVGSDGRQRLVGLTKHGRSLIPILRVRWEATQHAAEQLDRELSVPLSKLLAEAIVALSERRFAERIAEYEEHASEIAR